MEACRLRKGDTVRCLSIHSMASKPDSKTAPELVTEFERAVDASYACLPLPSSERYLNVFYLLSASESFLLDLCVRPPSRDSFLFQLDHHKYSLLFGLRRIHDEARSITHVQIPHRTDFQMSASAHQLLTAGVSYSDAVRTCWALHQGSVQLIRKSDHHFLAIDENPRNAQYAALQLILDTRGNQDTHLSSLLVWLNDESTAPDAVSQIAKKTKKKNEFLSYTMDLQLALRLRESLPRQPTFIPDNWSFPWGDTRSTQALIDALCLRCIYHLVANHFGRKKWRRHLLDGTRATVCLCVKSDDLVRQLALLSNIPRSLVQRFVEYLTYGNGTTHPDPALQPLVPINEGQCLIPCVHWLSSHHGRNILTLQNRLDREHFDSLSSAFEEAMTKRVVEGIRKQWPTLRTNKHVPGAAAAGELDLTVLDERNKALLVVELRWMLPPGDAREVRERACDAREKPAQLGRMINVVKSGLIATLKDFFSIRVDASQLALWEVYGVVVIEGASGFGADLNDLPIMPSRVFIAGLQTIDSLRTFNSWSTSLDWLPNESSHYTIAVDARRVGETTIDMPGVRLLHDDDYFSLHISKTMRGASARHLS